MTTAETLRLLAANHRWTWHRPTRALLDQLPGSGGGRHPFSIVAAMDPGDLDRWAESREPEIEALGAELSAMIAAAPPPRVAYLSPEFGMATEVPQYSGGLGILAGDHLKAASDLGVALVGVGLLYRGGFFRQSIEGGRQQERYETVSPVDIAAEDTGVTVDVPISGRSVAAKVWRQQVGGVQLLLLDTDVESNGPEDRRITDKLYSGDRRHRLDQELVLGVGGIRALRAVGIEAEVVHLNEGHACFGLLELLATELAAGTPIEVAIDAVRAMTLFTTHTPVPAGIDRFDEELIRPELDHWASVLGVPADVVAGWGHLPGDDPGTFNTAALAFELSGRANGVSQLHAQVSRGLFATLPRAADVEGITNGVHAGTWVAGDLQDLYDRCLGKGWEWGDDDAWSRSAELDREAFEAIREAGRHRLRAMVTERAGVPLAEGGCIIGFARRFATYKRATLLLRDRAGLVAALDGGARFVFAGKAHPADADGKAVLAELAVFADSPEGRGRLVLVPDYDIDVAQTLYAGSDVWLNTPVRPREACGTSGEKAALNGVLNCSILDGWWADWYTEGIGWAIPTSDATDGDERDAAEGAAVNALLGGEVLPHFADRDRWWSTTVAMLTHLGPRVTAGRMVNEYDERFYRPIQAGAPVPRR